MIKSSRLFFTAVALLSLPPADLCAQNTAPPQLISAPHPPLRLDIPHTWNPIDPYRGTNVSQPNLANSPRIDALIQNGVLELSLQDAIALALENNLDLAIARYNIPIAQADILRTQAGGIFRGVNTGVVQNTPGAGVGGFGSGTGGAGAGGTTGGAGGAGTGAGGTVQNTLGSGAIVSSYDPTITYNAWTEHYTEPLANDTLYGVPLLHSNSVFGNFTYTQTFATGTTLQFVLNNDRIATNSLFNILTPELDSYYRIEFQQQLLSGFALGPNLPYLRLPRKKQNIP